MKIYWLHINTNNEQTYNAVSTIMKVEPEPNEESWFNKNLYQTWSYKAVETEDDPVCDFIECFLNLLEDKYEVLAKHGIKRTDILFWLVYEYDQQCAMEFHPQQMKRLGENGIILNIDCHAKER